MPSAHAIAKLPPFYQESSLINVVIETPKNAAYKLKYDEEAGIFRLHKALPVGFVFPFNFGFVPSTVGGDGDPLDVLLLSDYIMPTGAVLLGKLISVLEAEQTENKKTQRNDRLVALPIEVVSRKPMKPAVEFNSALKTAIVDFFTKYNELEGKKFRALGYASSRRALQTVRKGMSRTTY